VTGKRLPPNHGTDGFYFRFRRHYSAIMAAFAQVDVLRQHRHHADDQRPGRAMRTY
jgi:ethanolamine utilization protein EutP (predicted NTPase)